MTNNDYRTGGQSFLLSRTPLKSIRICRLAWRACWDEVAFPYFCQPLIGCAFLSYTDCDWLILFFHAHLIRHCLFRFSRSVLHRFSILLQINYFFFSHLPPCCIMTRQRKFYAEQDLLKNNNCIAKNRIILYEIAYYIFFQ